MLQVTWVLLGVIILVAAMMGQRNRRAFHAGIYALAFLEIVAGALANIGLLLSGEDYRGFAAGSSFAFVRDTWASLVVPHHVPWILLLIAFEATAGFLVLRPGEGRRVALWLLVAFHVALLAFSWWYLLWSGPMVAALLLLLQADEEWSPVEASWSRVHHHETPRPRT